jgi:hypothetical protein
VPEDVRASRERDLMARSKSKTKRTNDEQQPKNEPKTLEEKLD